MDKLNILYLHGTQFTAEDHLDIIIKDSLVIEECKEQALARELEWVAPQEFFSVYLLQSVKVQTVHFNKLLIGDI